MERVILTIIIFWTLLPWSFSLAPPFSIDKNVSPFTPPDYTSTPGYQLGDVPSAPGISGPTSPLGLAGSSQPNPLSGLTGVTGMTGAPPMGSPPAMGMPNPSMMGTPNRNIMLPPNPNMMMPPNAYMGYPPVSMARYPMNPYMGYQMNPYMGQPQPGMAGYQMTGVPPPQVPSQLQPTTPGMPQPQPQLMVPGSSPNNPNSLNQAPSYNGNSGPTYLPKGGGSNSVPKALQPPPAILINQATSQSNSASSSNSNSQKSPGNNDGPTTVTRPFGEQALPQGINNVPSTPEDAQHVRARFWVGGNSQPLVDGGMAQLSVRGSCYDKTVPETNVGDLSAFSFLITRDILSNWVLDQNTISMDLTCSHGVTKSNDQFFVLPDGMEANLLDNGTQIIITTTIGRCTKYMGHQTQIASIKPTLRGQWGASTFGSIHLPISCGVITSLLPFDLSAYVMQKAKEQGDVKKMLQMQGLMPGQTGTRIVSTQGPSQGPSQGQLSSPGI